MTKRYHKKQQPQSSKKQTLRTATQGPVYQKPSTLGPAHTSIQHPKISTPGSANTITRYTTHGFPDIDFGRTVPTWKIKVFSSDTEIQSNIGQFAVFLENRGFPIQHRHNLTHALEAIANRDMALLGDAAQHLIVRDQRHAALNPSQPNHQTHNQIQISNRSRSFYQHNIASLVASNAHQARMAVKYGFDSFIYCHVPDYRRFQAADEYGMIWARLEWKVVADIMEAVMGVLRMDGPGWEATVLRFMEEFELDLSAAGRYRK